MTSQLRGLTLFSLLGLVACATAGSGGSTKPSGVVVRSAGGCTTDARNRKDIAIGWQVTPSGDADLCASLQRALESELVRLGFDVVTGPNAPFVYEAKMRTHQQVKEDAHQIHAVTEVDVVADGRVIDHVRAEGDFADSADYARLAAKTLTEKLLASRRLPRSGERGDTP